MTERSKSVDMGVRTFSPGNPYFNPSDFLSILISSQVFDTTAHSTSYSISICAVIILNWDKNSLLEDLDNSLLLEEVSPNLKTKSTPLIVYLTL
jgi:hypothetical protein